MSGPFASLAQAYVECGFSPIPILPITLDPLGKGKRPGYVRTSGAALAITKWQRYCRSPITPDEIDRIVRADPGAGIGIACGFRDLIGVDVDDARAFGVVREVLGGLSAPAKRGQKGACALFRGPGIASRKLCERAAVGPDGKQRRQTLVEFLGMGNQTLLPDTIHPVTGQPYRWVRGELLDVQSPEELPLLTPRMVSDIEAALAPLMEPKRETQSLLITPNRPAADLTELERRRYEGFAWTALESECASLAGMNKPGRNDAVFRLGCLLGRWVWHGILSTSDLECAVKSACETNRLIADNTWHDVLNTLKDGLARAANDSLPILAERARIHQAEKHHELTWN